MWILIIPLAILAVFTVTSGFVAAEIVDRMRLDRRGQWIVYGVLLGLSLLPTIWHYRSTIVFASGYGAYHPDQPVGFYPGLRLFQLAVPFGTILLWAGSWGIARRAPLLAAGVPGVAFVAYFCALGWVGADPPGVVLASKQTIFLFLIDIAAVFGLATYALAVWRAPWVRRPPEWF